jgi:hypothetical protein
MQEAFSSTKATPGSIFGGTPAVVSGFTRFIDELPSLYLSVVEKTISDYERSIQKEASVPEVWGESGSGVSIKLNKKDMSLSFSIPSSAVDLEYGFGESPPKSVLRTTVVKAERELPTRLTKALNALLVKRGFK